MAQSRPLAAIIAPTTLTQFQQELENEGAGYSAGRSQVEVERDLRARVDGFHLEVFNRTQAETTKRWTYESEIKRPYFHVTDLDEGQLTNWRKYLDYEEAEGDYVRTTFLYERCLVTCAQYDEFWLRYARWMLGQPSKEEEVRNIYQRASCFYVPIALPTTRLQYAFFEEMSGRVDVAKDIHEAILVNLPGHIDTIVSLANVCRRQGGLEDAIEVYKAQIGSSAVDISAKASLVAEWATLLWKIKGSSEEARQVFKQNENYYLESGPFWTSYLRFEIDQPTSAESEKEHYVLIKQVVDNVVIKSKLPEQTVKGLVTRYMKYLLERGTKEAAKEYMELDREINGPVSAQKGAKTRIAPGDKMQGVLNGQVRLRGLLCFTS
jgi:pre-mRNA-processing factor 39